MTATLGETELIITNVYIVHTASKLLCRRLSSFSGPSDDDDGYPNTERLQCTPLGVILKLDMRGTLWKNMISGFNFGILNWDSPTRLPGIANPSSPDVSLASASHHVYQLADVDEPRLRPSTNPH